MLEAIGAAGFASAETANVYLTSETGKICVVYEGKPLFPATEAQRTVLEGGNAKILAELGAGNYSASALYFYQTRNGTKSSKYIGDNKKTMDVLYEESAVNVNAPESRKAL